MSVVSPYGLGARAFGEGIRSGRRALTAADEGSPYSEAGTVDTSALHELLAEDCELTNRSQRFMGRPAGLAVGALTLLVREHSLAEFGPAERALVLGGDLTTIDRAMDLMGDSLTEKLPYQVDAKQLPSTAMNFPATQCAVLFGFQGPNSTITAGRVTGLSVLNYARRLHRAGRGPMAVAGAVEDLNPRRSWLAWHGLAGAQPRPLGEGCCLFLTETPESAAAHGRTPLARVLSLEFAAALAPADRPAALEACLRRALRKAEVDPSSVDLAVLSGADGGTERTAVSTVLGPAVRALCPTELIGDTAGASGAFGVAAALSDPSAEVAVLTALDPDGQLGCAVLRVLSHPTEGA
ncbi:beta-ketoacyl synthase N-terminal-like domain-containing protein [Amycolatopsis sp. PS_44_ISF1]|uniref:beta-ketoacyl synthase N-terminal-like domain-containing protein n=1 Tax=Amycolatopsis sp. PS_44_ISF1 TaxID=2974917 RepID=UPI0028DD55FD|nr:beta-ketoacyl synthase N-terminal-like domain-containing protein [Amycolatopsis sp. PS_44_ISF1]MDT8913894.1 hypothetical protein [Amycolatopsis sp. PS_44_ISF1]